MSEYNFRKGDIIRNLWVGSKNPEAYLLYIRKSSVKLGGYTMESYECLAYDGRSVHLFANGAKLEFVGHMEEYDKFIAALKNLKLKAEEEKENATD